MTRRKKVLDDFPTASMLCVEEDGEPAIYIVFDGVRIAKRGKPDTPQAKTWVSLVHGFEVRDTGKRGVEIFTPGERLQ
jgi:hypothetical protein